LSSGTTKSWRQYRDLVVGGCGLKRAINKKKIKASHESTHPPQGLEFNRLPSLHNTPSQEERQKGKDSENRVRMFVKDTTPQDSDSLSDVGSIRQFSTAPPPTTAPTHTSLGRTRSDSETRLVQFHRPRAVVTRNGRQLSTGDVGLNPHIEQADPVIQYGSQDWGRTRDSERDRRFVAERLPRQRNFLDSDSSYEFLSKG